MLAFLTNLGLPELTLIAAVAVIVFGKRLPEVAARAYAQVARLRHSLEELRRESGIDRELRNIDYEVRDAARRARLDDPLTPPPGLRQARTGSPGDSAADTDEQTEDQPEEPRDGPAPSPEPPAATPEPDDRADRRESG